MQKHFEFFEDSKELAILVLKGNEFEVVHEQRVLTSENSMWEQLEKVGALSSLIWCSTCHSF